MKTLTLAAALVALGGPERGLAVRVGDQLAKRGRILADRRIKRSRHVRCRPQRAHRVRAQPGTFGNLVVARDGGAEPAQLVLGAQHRLLLRGQNTG